MQAKTHQKVDLYYAKKSPLKRYSEPPPQLPASYADKDRLNMLKQFKQAKSQTLASA